MNKNIKQEIGKLVKGIALCNALKCSSCDNCTNKLLTLFNDYIADTKKIVALFGYPMDNSVRAKEFKDMKAVREEAERWKNISYFIVAFEVEGEFITEL